MTNKQLRKWAEDRAKEWHGYLSTKLAKAILRLLKKVGVCEWKYDEDCDCYETSCSQSWCFETGGVKENEQRYCGYCGKRIKEVGR